jgi:hypothetical protein
VGSEKLIVALLLPECRSPETTSKTGEKSVEVVGGEGATTMRNEEESGIDVV